MTVNQAAEQLLEIIENRESQGPDLGEPNYIFTPQPLRAAIFEICFSYDKDIWIAATDY